MLHTIFRKGGFYKPIELAAAAFPACKEQGRRAPAALEPRGRGGSPRASGGASGGR